MGKYVVNNELSEHALLTTELIKSSTFNVGDAVPVRVNEDESGQAKKIVSRQNYQKFIDITYPDGDKSASVIIPNCVMHHQLHDYYGKPSIYIGIPQTFVQELQLKLSTVGHSPMFSDKKILSDAHYFWIRSSFVPAAEGKEYIRMVDDQGELFYGSFAELFNEYPTSLIANITGTLKLKADTEMGKPLTGKETWRVGFQASMFTPFDATEVPAPSTGIGQRSNAGKHDVMRPGLAKFKQQQS